MADGYALIASEVAGVERYDILNPNGLHKCNQSGVVDGGALNSVLREQSSPTMVDCGRVVKNCCNPLDELNAPFGDVDTFAIAASRGLRTSRHVPELGDVLCAGCQ